MASGSLAFSPATLAEGRALAVRMRDEFLDKLIAIEDEHGFFVASEWGKRGRGKGLLRTVVRLNRQFPQAGGAA